MKLLYVCSADTGGILDYAVYQVRAMALAGIDVIFLCKPTFPVGRLPTGVHVEILELENVEKLKMFYGRGLLGRIFKAIGMISELRREAKRVEKIASMLASGSFQFLRADAPLVTRTAVSGDCNSYDDVCVLFDTFKEYFSPLWVWPLKRLAKKGVKIGTIAHDPVRNFIVGPKWWHRWSVRLGYSFVRHVFVHDDTPVDFGGPKPVDLEVHEVPFGPYDIASPTCSRESARDRFGFRADDIIFFSFGQIRDGKNLDLFLRAMSKLPKHVKFLVAGTVQSGSSRPIEYYQQLAEALGVSGQCRWECRRIPDEDVGDLFNLCDFVLLTYSAVFHSMSAVLGTAVSARKPVLASSGEGPLKKMVEKYRLGVFVRPDDADAILKGAEKMIEKYKSSERPDWARYECDNSWQRNVEIIMQAFQV